MFKYEVELTDEEEKPNLEDLDECDNDEYDGGEAVVVNLGFDLGDRFDNFQEFHNRFQNACKSNYVRFSKRDSRTIEAAKRKVVNRIFKPELEYYHLRYSCFFSQRNKSKGTGKRKRQSLSHKVIVACPASIALRTTDDGQFLEVYNVENFHNHPVNKEEYQQFLPKKKHGPLSDAAINKLVDQESTQYDKYKAVLAKSRQIAKLASVSDTQRVKGILKNLDDFIFYLKHTSGKQEADMENVKTEMAENVETVNEVDESESE